MIAIDDGLRKASWNQAYPMQANRREDGWIQIVIQERGTPIRKRYAGLVRLLVDHMIQDHGAMGCFEIQLAAKGARRELQQNQLRDFSPHGTIPRRMGLLASFYSQFLERPLQLKFTVWVPRGEDDCRLDCTYPPWFPPTENYSFIPREQVRIKERTRQKHNGREHLLTQRLLETWKTTGAQWQQCEISFHDVAFNYDLFLEDLDGAPTLVEIESASPGRDRLANLGALACLEMGASLLTWHAILPEGRLILEQSPTAIGRRGELQLINERLSARGGPRILLQSQDGCSDKLLGNEDAAIKALVVEDAQTPAARISKKSHLEGCPGCLANSVKRHEGPSSEMICSSYHEGKWNDMPIACDPKKLVPKENSAGGQTCFNCGNITGVGHFCPRCGSLNRRYQLVVISCAKTKIWSRSADRPKYVAARDAYVSPYFAKMKAFAELYGECYLILSARYGLLEPDHPICDYEATFRDSETGPVCEETIHRQILHQERFGKRLRGFREVCLVAGAAYEELITQAFRSLGAQVFLPLQGLRLGEKMQRLDELIKRAREAATTPASR